ncbi:hypothetical protein NE237_026901 [Protea cynaroides]|uniref:Uncharacterized protein n=1 Tax=Protea cynaroides TaxID=273540 RepID=A0A9Q0GMI6_9MAGN|nr:hypothetical protein NE237_026901 [Protea cynaroides]
MKARLLVFPIKGRNWCFSRSVDPSAYAIPSESHFIQASPTLRDLWKKISSNGKPMNENAELVVDFISDKMNRAWISFEKAPVGSFKNKIHGLGLRLLAGVKPSEILLKSISKDVTNIEVTYPKSLNPRLVRRRLRHIAIRGTIIHRRYFYGSIALLPFTTAFTVLPLPNIPFFWVLFRTYSNWRALQGSEKLLLLISDCSETQNSVLRNDNGKETSNKDSDSRTPSLFGQSWVLRPSKELDKLIRGKDSEDGLSKCVISDICKTYDLDVNAVLKYRNSV